MPDEIYLRFYEELNDYLPPERRKRDFAWRLEKRTSVRDMLEAAGVPLSEVEFVLVNGSSADISIWLSAGDRVSVYPVFESFNVTPLLRFRPEPLRRTRFIIDSGLQRLAYYLRLLGFDAPVDSVSPEHAAHLAEEGRRILLTTDPALATAPGLSRVYLVRGKQPREQLKEVLARLDLMDGINFSRLPSMIAGRLADKIRR